MYDNFKQISKFQICQAQNQCHLHVACVMAYTLDKLLGRLQIVWYPT